MTTLASFGVAEVRRVWKGTYSITLSVVAKRATEVTDRRGGVAS